MTVQLLERRPAVAEVEAAPTPLICFRCRQYFRDRRLGPGELRALGLGGDTARFGSAVVRECGCNDFGGRAA